LTGPLAIKRSGRETLGDDTTGWHDGYGHLNFRILDDWGLPSMTFRQFLRSSEEMMNTKMNRRIPGSVAIYCVTFIGLLLLPCTVLAQTSAKTSPVIVTNTTANPVPITGRVDVGTPTVKLDPDNNTVRLDPSATRIDFRGVAHNWAIGQTYVLGHVTENYSRIKICVRNAPTSPDQQDVVARVISRNVYDAVFDFEIGRLTAVRGGPAECKVFDLPGYQILVVIEGPLNTAGIVSVGLWGQPN